MHDFRRHSIGRTFYCLQSDTAVSDTWNRASAVRKVEFELLQLRYGVKTAAG